MFKCLMLSLLTWPRDRAVHYWNNKVKPELLLLLECLKFRQHKKRFGIETKSRKSGKKKNILKKDLKNSSLVWEMQIPKKQIFINVEKSVNTLLGVGT